MNKGLFEQRAGLVALGLHLDFGLGRTRCPDSWSISWNSYLGSASSPEVVIPTVIPVVSRIEVLVEFSIESEDSETSELAGDVPSEELDGRKATVEDELPCSVIHLLLVLRAVVLPYETGRRNRRPGNKSADKQSARKLNLKDALCRDVRSHQLEATDVRLKINRVVVYRGRTDGAHREGGNRRGGYDWQAIA